MTTSIENNIATNSPRNKMTYTLLTILCFIPAMLYAPLAATGLICSIPVIELMMNWHDKRKMKAKADLDRKADQARKEKENASYVKNFPKQIALYKELRVLEEKHEMNNKIYGSSTKEPVQVKRKRKEYIKSFGNSYGTINADRLQVVKYLIDEDRNI